METNLFTSRSPFAKIFKSSINKRWFTFLHFSSYTLILLFLISGSRVSHTNHKYINGDKLSPRDMPLLISVFAKYSPHDVNFVFQFFIDFLISSTIFSDNPRMGNHIISFLVINLCHFQISVSLLTIIQPYLIN